LDAKLDIHEMLTTRENRSGAELPKNFKDIRLGSRLVGILQAHGVRYDEG
jgi:hypothetical protein